MLLLIYVWSISNFDSLECFECFKIEMKLKSKYANKDVYVRNMRKS